MGERTRAFLAFLLEQPILDAAADVQRQMRELFTPGSVKWVDPDNFHITVRFFGDLDRKGLDRALRVVEQLDGRFEAVPVRIDAVSAFPSPSRPQTLWIGVSSGEEGLAALAGRVDLALREAGFGRSDKAWKSHLTIGRVRRGVSARVPQDWTAGLTWAAGDSNISRIALMESELRPEGPRYTPLRMASALR